VFERTVVPRDFDAIDVPYPEKGEPEIERFEPERARA
jgi:ribonuclease Z